MTSVAGDSGGDAVLARERQRAVADQQHVLAVLEHAARQRHRMAQPRHRADGADRGALRSPLMTHASTSTVPARVKHRAVAGVELGVVLERAHRRLDRVERAAARVEQRPPRRRRRFAAGDAARPPRVLDVPGAAVHDDRSRHAGAMLAWRRAPPRLARCSCSPLPAARRRASGPEILSWQLADGRDCLTAGVGAVESRTVGLARRRAPIASARCADGFAPATVTARATRPARGTLYLDGVDGLGVAPLPRRARARRRAARHRRDARTSRSTPPRRSSARAQLRLVGEHDALLGRGGVVVAEEVHQAVHRQMEQLGQERVARRLRLPRAPSRRR